MRRDKQPNRRRKPFFKTRENNQVTRKTRMNPTCKTTRNLNSKSEKSIPIKSTKDRKSYLLRTGQKSVTTFTKTARLIPLIKEESQTSTRTPLRKRLITTGLGLTISNRKTNIFTKPNSPTWETCKLNRTWAYRMLKTISGLWDKLPQC